MTLDSGFRRNDGLLPKVDDSDFAQALSTRAGVRSIRPCRTHTGVRASRNAPSRLPYPCVFRPRRLNFPHNHECQPAFGTSTLDDRANDDDAHQPDDSDVNSGEIGFYSDRPAAATAPQSG